MMVLDLVSLKQSMTIRMFVIFCRPFFGEIIETELAKERRIIFMFEIFGQDDIAKAMRIIDDKKFLIGGPADYI